MCRRGSRWLALLTLALFPCAPELALCAPPPGDGGSLAASLIAAATARGIPAEDVSFSLRLPDGEVISHRPEAPMRPASCQKLLTVAATLGLLGQTAEVVTELRSSQPVSAGVFEGDLVLVGGGDPGSLSSAAEHPGALLEEWAELVAQLGVTAVRGAIIGDDRALAGPSRHPDWPRNQLHRWYAAPSGALNVRDNCVEVTITPADGGRRFDVRLDPPLAPFEIDNRLVAVARARDHLFSIDRAPGSWSIRLRGKFLRSRSPWRGWVTVEDPTIAYLESFRIALRRRGIEVIGGCRRGAHRASDPIVARRSRLLSSFVPRMLKRSQNLLADCAFRVLGRRTGGDGSFATGARAVDRFVRELAPGEDPFVVRDGSGLSTRNVVTARRLLALLEASRREPWGARLRAALPVAGVDGTLARRFRKSPVRGRVRAKTGHLAGVSSLAGFLRDRNGREIPFALLYDARGKASSAADRWQEAALELLDGAISPNAREWREGHR